jgi:hypothetical protein
MNIAFAEFSKVTVREVSLLFPLAAGELEQLKAESMPYCRHSIGGKFGRKKVNGSGRILDVAKLLTLLTVWNVKFSMPNIIRHNQGKQALKRIRGRLGLPINRELLPTNMVIYLFAFRRTCTSEEVNANPKAFDKCFFMSVVNQTT